MTTPVTNGPARPQGAINLAAVLLTFFFVWIVFDNLALALIFAAFAGGGSELAQRAANRKPEGPPAA